MYLHIHIQLLSESVSKAPALTLTSILEEAKETSHFILMMDKFSTV